MSQEHGRTASMIVYPPIDEHRIPSEKLTIDYSAAALVAAAPLPIEVITSPSKRHTLGSPTWRSIQTIWISSRRVRD